MARSETITASYDAFTNEASPNKNFGDRSTLRVNGTPGSQRRIFIYFPIDIRKYAGATIFEAILRIHHAATNASATYEVRRVTAKWREGQITWNNNPGSTAVGALNITGGGVDKDRFDLDVTSLVQSWAGGSAAYGFRIAVPTSAPFDFYSSESSRPLAPKLMVTWAPPLEPPANLHPDGGSAIASANPLLTWDGPTPAQVHVQIDEVPDFSSPILDSDWVDSVETQYDTSLDPAPPNLADNTVYYWRAQYSEPEFGRMSDWSDTADFERRTQGVLAITAPSSTVETTTPTVSWTFTGRVQASYNVRLYEGTVDGTLLWQASTLDGGIVGADTSFEIPEGYVAKSGTTYTAQVEVWDTYTRDAVGGDTSVIQTKAFTFQTNAAVSPVTNLAAVTEDGHLLVSWTRSSTPDYFAVRRDGVVVYDRLEPGDVSAGGTNYALRVYNAQPRVTSTYVVEAVVLTSGVYKHSQSNPSVTGTFAPLGIWVTDPDSGVEVRVLGEDDAQGGMGETGETFYPLGRSDPVRLIDQQRGMEGTVTGTFVAFGSRTAAFERASFFALLSDPLAERRLVLGYVNVPVLIGEATCLPTPEEEETYDVGFSFWQVDEFAFE